MFKRLLIANRGEIACRVMRTARRLGIETVAVYSDADRDALFVREADHALRIGPAPARASYLSIDALVDAACRSGADAVHPGYGFLAENADFAAACVSAGCTFVGPSADAIRAMGSKIEAKRIVAAAGTPVVPGFFGSQEAGRLAAEAAQIGYPLMIKASAGGGGKGMRVVWAADAFVSALGAARREAKAAFGDDAVLLEKYLAEPKHIEVQVLADAHGRTLYLFERDCSVQRRHQKVIEEAPAPTVTAAQRTRMGEAAINAAAAIGYLGAGTIEFMADASGFYFMEMNTRLQVEHPVTEAVVGIDLVEWQLRVAAGEALPFAQDDLSITGHAVEARIYAENPRRKFLPSTGVLKHVRLPDGVRVDTGVATGSEVTMHYDPMIAKVIAHGGDRVEAIGRLHAALGEIEIAGVEHNVAFLRRVLDDAAFRGGDYTTGLLDARGDALIDSTPDPRFAMAATLALVLSSRSDSPWQQGDAFRINQRWRQTVRLRHGTAPLDVDVEAFAGGFELRVATRQVKATGVRLVATTLVAFFDGDVFRCGVVVDAATVYVMHDGATETFVLRELDAASFDAAASDGRVVAPMPGQIIALHVRSGATVRRDQPILVLEAMKMEHTIVAPLDGRLDGLTVAVGDRVVEGAELFRVV
jgi:3-methylcrotonyl-CoA carboxylase alpha subunit